MSIQYKNKFLLKNALSFMIAFSMIFGLMLPLASFTASAEAPAYYTSITANSTTTVNITYSGEIQYFKFVPTETGVYTFYSSNQSGDPYGILMDENGNSLASSDDANGNNFEIEYECAANTVYYIAAKMYGSNTGSYTLAVDAPLVIPQGTVQTLSGNHSYALFNSGRKSGSGYSYAGGSSWTESTRPNYDESSFTNGGYDIYSNADYYPYARWGLSFVINSEVIERGRLTINAYDVDESGGEIDYVYLVDVTSGTETRLDSYLSGMNNQWNTTVFTIDPSCFTVGHEYYFKVYNSVSGWHAFVRTVSIELTTEEDGSEPVVPEGPYITTFDFSASIDSYGQVTTDLYLESNQDVTYYLEYAATISGDQRGSALDQSIDVTPSGTSKQVTFRLENGAPQGVYAIDVIVKDAYGNTVASYNVSAGYAYRAVSYHSNGGSNNLPTDVTPYSNGDTVTVLFDYLPIRSGYVFLGWATSDSATTPDFTEDGTNTFTMGESDVVLYAVWEAAPEEEEPELGIGNVLLVEEELPWNYDSNTVLLNNLLSDGKIEAWDKISVSEITLAKLQEYAVVYLVGNDQSNSVYQALAEKNEDLIEYATSGGVLIFGACLNPSDSATLLGSISVTKITSNQNYIADADHPIVTQKYSSGETIDQSVLIGNSCNHVYFTSLPQNSNVIFTDTSGRATLAEYAQGDGHVIVSGLTWEHYYGYNSGGPYSELLYDDLILYALSLSDGGNVQAPVVDVWDGTVDTSWYNDSDTEFVIYTAEQLAGLAQLVNNGNSFSGKTIYLGNSIDLAQIHWTPIGITENNCFSGTFDGNFFEIYGAKIVYAEARDSLNGSGLFGNVKNASLKNVGVVGYDYQAEGGRAGGLCGVLHESTMSNCYATGTLTFVLLRLTGEEAAGGLIGDVRGESTVENCYANCDLITTSSDSSKLSMGGLIGFVCVESPKYVYNCYANSNITSPSVNANGGFIGTLFYGTLYMENCFSDSTVNQSKINMLIGEQDSEGISYKSISNSYYSSEGSDSFGGTGTDASNFASRNWVETYLGWDFETVWTYESGNAYPVLQGFAAGGGVHIHSFVETSRTEAGCTTEGEIGYLCGCGETQVEIIPELGHSFAGGICTRCGAAEYMDLWDGSIADAFGGGSGTEADPYLIYTGAQLAYLAQTTNNGNNYANTFFKLMNNIDLNCIAWTPIGVGTITSASNNTSYTFNGSFDGNGCVISNLLITESTTSFTGLFGCLNYATISHLGIEDAYVTATGIDTYRCAAGILAGGSVNEVTIRYCYVTGAITVDGNDGYLDIGSIIGNCYGAIIYDCYAHADIVVNSSRDGHVGGLVGFLDSSSGMARCFYYGELPVTNSVYVGAIHSNEGTGSIEDCYYYTYLDTDGATYVDQSDLLNQAVFEGFDFTAVWEMGEEHPVLRGFDQGGAPVHYHNFIEISRTEVGCVTWGEIIYSCGCGHTYSELIAPLMHDYQITDSQDPTCTEDGYIEFTCQNDGCGAIKRQIIDKLEHDYDGDNVCDICGHTIETHSHAHVVTVVEPTCTTMGYTEYVCACGHSYRDSYVEPVRHEWNEGEITIASTCVSDGVMTFTCGNCGATKTSVIPAAHQWGDVVTIDKTCTTDGSVTKVCAVCALAFIEIIPAGHNWNEGEQTLAPTCKEVGAKTCTCADCGAVEEFEIPVLGHSYVDGVCTRCGIRFIEDITPSEHPLYGMYFEIDDILSDYGPSLIDEYGLMLDYNSDATLEKVAVFLTQDGTMWRRCIAVKGTNIEYATYVPYLSYQSEIKYSGLNHDWINIFRLRENADGIWCYNNYATIGANLQDAYGNLLLSLYHIGQAGAETRIFDDLDEMIAWLNDDCFEHQTSDWIVDVEATATQAGSRHKECTLCGEVLETEILPILASIVVNGVKAEAGSLVQVTIDVQNNPGIIGAVLTLDFDDALTLVAVDAGSAWNSLAFTRPAEYTNPCNFVWDGLSGADYSNGSIIVLTFLLPEDAQAGTSYSVNVSYTADNMLNADLEPMHLVVQNGEITVVEEAGDVNGDGVIDVADVMALRRYLAGGYEIEIDLEASDMDSNGTINVADVILLRRYLVG